DARRQNREHGSEKHETFALAILSWFFFERTDARFFHDLRPIEDLFDPRHVRTDARRSSNHRPSPEMLSVGASPRSADEVLHNRPALSTTLPARRSAPD